MDAITVVLTTSLVVNVLLILVHWQQHRSLNFLGPEKLTTCARPPNVFAAMEVVDRWDGKSLETLIDSLCIAFNYDRDAVIMDLINERDEAEEAADAMASLILNESIGWTYHNDAWKRAIDKAKE